jgi:hypothetical protein
MSEQRSRHGGDAGFSEWRALSAGEMQTHIDVARHLRATPQGWFAPGGTCYVTVNLRRRIPAFMHHFAGGQLRSSRYRWKSERTERHTH